jgi:hypothetical protein
MYFFQPELFWKIQRTESDHYTSGTKSSKLINKQNKNPYSSEQAFEMSFSLNYQDIELFF